MPERPPAGQTVVLLIDYDNLQICASRDTPGVELDLQAVMSLAQSYGTVIVARAYAEWNHLTERLNAFRVGIEPAFAPVLRTEASGRNGGKSLADTVIVADGVDLLWRLSPDVFVLATSDKDLIPLVRLVKQRGSEVVVVGSDLTAVPLVEMANHFVTYRQLISDREHEKERERTQERERMRVAHEARRDEAMRARDQRRVNTRLVEQDDRARVEERPRAALPRERARVEPALPAALLSPSLGEQALAAGVLGAAGAEGSPTRRRRRRRSRGGGGGGLDDEPGSEQLTGVEATYAIEPGDEQSEEPIDTSPPPEAVPLVDPSVAETRPAGTRGRGRRPSTRRQTQQAAADAAEERTWAQGGEPEQPPPSPVSPWDIERDLAEERQDGPEPGNEADIVPMASAADYDEDAQPEEAPRPAPRRRRPRARPAAPNS